jgi:uncharacterized Zn finger protein
MAGYHINEIPNGIFGTFSKVIEEFLEFEDSIEQKSVVMELVELSDLIGAIEAFLDRNSNESLNDILEKIKTNNSQISVDYAELKENFSILNHAVKMNDYSKFEGFLDELNCYVRKYNLTINDLHIMSEITKRVFVTGCRPSKG